MLPAYNVKWAEALDRGSVDRGGGGGAEIRCRCCRSKEAMEEWKSGRDEGGLVLNKMQASTYVDSMRKKF